MFFSLQGSIKNFLIQQHYKNNLRYVPSQEIRAHLRTTYPQQSWSDNDYLKAIRSLINQRFIEEDIECYRIKPEGRLNYETNQTNAAFYISRFVLVIIMIAGIGFFYSISSPRTTGNSSFPNLPTFVPVPLSSIVDENSHSLTYGKLQDFFDQIPNNASFNGQFALSADSTVVETGSSNSTNPWEIDLLINQQGVRKLHLLINLSHTTANLVKEVKDQAICRIYFFAESGKMEQIELFAGKNIRDWLIGKKDGTNTISDPGVETWTAQQPKTKTKAVIDHLTLDVPEGMRQERIKTIVIDDRSWEILENENPGVVIFGITLEK